MFASVPYTRIMEIETNFNTTNTTNLTFSWIGPPYKNILVPPLILFQGGKLSAPLALIFMWNAFCYSVGGIILGSEHFWTKSEFIIPSTFYQVFLSWYRIGRLFLPNPKKINVQPDQINMAFIIWYLIKSDIVYAIVHWTRT